MWAKSNVVVVQQVDELLLVISIQSLISRISTFNRTKRGVTYSRRALWAIGVGVVTADIDSLALDERRIDGENTN